MSAISRRRESAARAALFAGLLTATTCAPSGPSPSQLRVTSIQPTSGSTFGGTSVTISGSAFSAGATVSVGGVPATSIAVPNETTITAVTAQHAAGPADVVVTVGGQSASLASAFTYITPSTGSNVPPAIEALSARGSRPNQPAGMADLNEAIAVTAVVSDPETPVESLIYEWSATAGVFEGAGSSVVWRAPVSVPGTPVDVTLTLTVIERFTAPNEQGLPVTHEHRVTGTTIVRVHNSVQEVRDLARDFLTLFSMSSVPPADVVANFSDACPGKQQELADVIRQRCLVTVNAFTVGGTTPTINFGGVCVIGSEGFAADACAVVHVRWEDTVNANPQQCPDPPAGAIPGSKQVTEGDDLVTAIYENKRWRLCDSRFHGATLPLWLRGRRIR